MSIWTLIFIQAVIIVGLFTLEPYLISWARFKRKFCRCRQMRHNKGDVVIFRHSRIKAVVSAYRWNTKSRCWEYHLEGFPGWTKQNLIK